LIIRCNSSQRRRPVLFGSHHGVLELAEIELGRDIEQRPLDDRHRDAVMNADLGGLEDSRLVHANPLRRDPPERRVTSGTLPLPECPRDPPRCREKAQR
jgi:hypothetical protein